MRLLKTIEVKTIENIEKFRLLVRFGWCIQVYTLQSNTPNCSEFDQNFIQKQLRLTGITGLSRIALWW